MKSTSLTLIFVMLFSMAAGCAGNAPAVRAPTQDLIDSFGPVENRVLLPLQPVEVPPRDDPPQGSMFYRLKLGEIAPIDGFLFTDPATAFLVTTYEATVQRYELALTSQRERDFARLKLETDTLTLQMNTDRDKFGLVIHSFDVQVQDLQDIIRGQNSIFHNIWPVIAVGAIGVIVGFAIGVYAAN